VTLTRILDRISTAKATLGQPQVKGWCNMCLRSCHKIWLPASQRDLAEADCRQHARLFHPDLCPACTNEADYCPGHGQIGDPAGYALLVAAGWIEEESSDGS
jgi:hypothetical protein